MEKKYVFYRDYTQSYTEFNSIDDLLQHVADIYEVTKDRIGYSFDEENDTDIIIKDKFGDNMRVVGFAYISSW